MSQAEDLLNGLEEPIETHSSNPDTEPHIVINSDRTVTIPEVLKHIAVQGDHNIETVTFDCPRYWDGHDLSKMSIKIVYQRSDGHREPYPVGDVIVDDIDVNMIHFDWTLSGNVTEVKGNISFTVCAKLSDAEGNIQHEWHTRLSQDLVVDEGMDCSGDEIAERNPDIIEAILVRLAIAEQGGVSGERHYPDWSHLKWYGMGDSLTDPDGRRHTDKFYYEYIAEKTGIQVIVDGKGGTGYYAGASTNTRFADRVKNIPADVDIVTIFGSGNDILHGDYDSYKSSVGETMAYFYDNRPGLPVIIMPPSPWKGYSKRGEEWKTYCDYLELAALNYSLRYVDDMFKCPPFDPNSASHLAAFFNKDASGIHPDENGHREIARYFYNALLQELALKV